MGYFNPITEQFGREYPRGKRAEIYACKVLGGELAQEGDVDGDIILPSGEKVEVKYDKISKRTGKVAIEYKSYGNERGIMRSGARFYFIVCYDRDWSEIVDGIKTFGWWVGILIEKSTLLEMIETLPYPDVNGGDNGATKMRLVPVEDVKAYCDNIFPIKH